MEVRIGMIQVPRELDVDMGDQVDGDQLSADIEKLVGEGSGVLWLTDKKGKRVGVPIAKLAYIEIGPHGESHRVGFGGPPPAAKSKK